MAIDIKDVEAEEDRVAGGVPIKHRPKRKTNNSQWDVSMVGSRYG